jgi:hypothetical protein
MTNQDKIKYLSDYKNIVREYVQLKDRYANVIEKKDGVKAQVITAMPVNHSPSSDKMCDNLCESDRLNQLIADRLDMLDGAKLEVESAISRIKESLFRTLLSRRYIDGFRWEEVAVDMRFSWQHTHRLHNEAIEKIEIIIKDESK